jgi:hypothetical protein
MPHVLQAMAQPAPNQPPSRYLVNKNGSIVAYFAAPGEQPRVGDKILFEVVDEGDAEDSQFLHANLPQSEIASPTAIQPESYTAPRPSYFAGEPSNFKTPVDLADQRRAQQAVPVAVTEPFNLDESDPVKHPARPSTRIERLKKRFNKLVN